MSDQQPPKQIYLQAYDSDSYDDNTWCQDKINDEDIEYILQSEYDQLKAENEKLKKMLAYIRDYSDEGIDEDLNGWLRVKQTQKLAEQALNEVKE